LTQGGNGKFERLLCQELLLVAYRQGDSTLAQVHVVVRNTWLQPEDEVSVADSYVDTDGLLQK
jgi:hypothetical protein